MSIIVKFKSNPVAYNENRRIRVNQTVIYEGKYFQSKTGVNSIPQEDGNWMFLGLVNAPLFGNLKIASKGAGNTGSGIEAGDIVYGMLDDGTNFIPFGKYLGPIQVGNEQNIDNYETSVINFNNL